MIPYLLAGVCGGPGSIDVSSRLPSRVAETLNRSAKLHFHFSRPFHQFVIQYASAIGVLETFAVWIRAGKLVSGLYTLRSH